MSNIQLSYHPARPGKTLSWNGVSINVPTAWNIDQLDQDGLILEEQGLPVLSVGWRRTSDNFDPQTDLKQIEKDLGVTFSLSDSTQSIRAWSDAVLKHEKKGIRTVDLGWTGNNGTGVGAYMHHPKSGLTIILLFHFNAGNTEREAAKVLYSVRDHWGGESLPIAIYDIRARLTPEYAICKYSNRDDVLHMEFRRSRQGRPTTPETGRGTRLVLERHANAAAALKDKRLDQWLVQVRKLELPGKPLTVEPGRVSWSGQAPGSLWARFSFRMEHCRGRLWVDKQRNMLFLVHGQGIRPVTKKELADVCEFFEPA